MIPPLVHQIWFGGNIPNHLANFMSACRRFHPSWTWKLWREEDVAKLPVFGKIAPNIMPRSLGADLARAEILFREGGFYLDTDIELARGINFVRGRDVLALREDAIRLSACFLAGRPGHPLFRNYMSALSTFMESVVPGQKNTTGYTGRELLANVFDATAKELTNGCSVDLVGQRLDLVNRRPTWAIVDKPSASIIAFHHPQISWANQPFKVLETSNGQ